MNLLHYCLVAIGLIAIFIFRLIVKDAIRSRKYKLPPRVPGLPFFGNMFQVPPLQQGPWAKDLAEKYGEMFTVKFGGTDWVFLNSSRVVEDLMEKRSAIYSSRPPFPMVQDVISDHSRIVLMPYDEKWRQLRKIMHNILSKKPLFKPFQDLESKHLLYDYLHTPSRWYDHNGRFANSVICSIIYGRRSDLDDPQTKELFETVELFLENQQPGKHLVETFQFLNNLPQFLHWWRPYGLRIMEKTRQVYKREMDAVVQRLNDGTQKDCFCVQFLADSEKQGFSETQKLFTMGTLIEAGSDTSKVSLGQIIAGAATYPDWVATARAQLDEVCGSNAERLPTFEDRARLPYITAVVKEGFRWRPNIAEIGAPTALIQDDEYEGYKFPAGTVFTWNAWAIALDPKEYKDPERFWPERFINDDLDKPLKGHYAFGPGRRVCVGWSVGEMNVWIAAARLLYCFDFKEDPNHPIDTMRIPQVTHGKNPFEVKISVRSKRHAALIDRDCKEAVATKY